MGNDGVTTQGALPTKPDSNAGASATACRTRRCMGCCAGIGPRRRKSNPAAILAILWERLQPRCFRPPPSRASGAPRAILALALRQLRCLRSFLRARSRAALPRAGERLHADVQTGLECRMPDGWVGTVFTAWQESVAVEPARTDPESSANHGLHGASLHMKRDPGSTHIHVLSGMRSSWTHFAFANASVMSSMRFEKPHSLSYQLSTLTRVPSITRVWVAS